MDKNIIRMFFGKAIESRFDGKSTFLPSDRNFPPEGIGKGFGVFKCSFSNDNNSRLNGRMFCQFFEAMGKQRFPAEVTPRFRRISSKARPFPRGEQNDMDRLVSHGREIYNWLLVQSPSPAQEGDATFSDSLLLPKNEVLRILPKY